MNWYVAEASFRSEIDGSDPSYTPLYETSWFLVSADGEASASDKAAHLAQIRQEAYANVDGETVRWKLVRIVRIREVMDEILTDGTEIWSEIRRAGSSGEEIDR